MDRSTSKKIIACTLIWVMFVNACRLNARYELSDESDTKIAPEAAADTIPADGSTVDPSLNKPLSESRYEYVDSALIRLLKISKNERFSMTMVNGDTYTGRIKLRANGVEIRIKKYDKKIKFEKQIISWSEIKHIRLVPKHSQKKIALIYLIILPVGIAALWLGGAASN